MNDAILAVLYAVAGLAIFVLMLAGLLLKEELNKLETRVNELEHRDNDHMRGKGA